MGSGDRREQSQQTQYPQPVVLDHIGDDRMRFLLVGRFGRHCARIRISTLDGLPVSCHDSVAVHPE